MAGTAQSDKAAESCAECVDVASQILNKALVQAESGEVAGTVQRSMQREMVVVRSSCENRQSCMENLGMVSLVEPALAEEDFIRQFIVVSSRFVEFRHRLEALSPAGGCWLLW